jgi:hypothetical protein
VRTKITQAAVERIPLAPERSATYTDTELRGSLGLVFWGRVRCRAFWLSFGLRNSPSMPYAKCLSRGRSAPQNRLPLQDG